MEEIIKLDAEKYEGVNFHVAKIPIPDPKAAEVFGDSVQIVVGINHRACTSAPARIPSP